MYKIRIDTMNIKKLNNKLKYIYKIMMDVVNNENLKREMVLIPIENKKNKNFFL